MGNHSNHTEAPGRVTKNFSGGTGYICIGCGETSHFQKNCECVKALIAKEAIIYNCDGRICLPDGSHVPNIPAGAHLVEQLDRYYANIKLSQAYYGALKEMEEKICSTLS